MQFDAMVVHFGMVGRFGETPLHFAARSGQLEAVKELLSCEADPTVMGKYGTPADVALSGNQVEVGALLAGKRCLQLVPSMLSAISSNRSMH
jgi:hypothetical protein